MKVEQVLPGIDLEITGEKGDGFKILDTDSQKNHWKYSAGEFQQLTGIYEKNGVAKDAIRIAMEATGTYRFKFALKNAAGEPVEVDEFPLVFYDMDYWEQVKACGVAGHVLNKDTHLKKEEDEVAKCVTFKAESIPAESPDDFDNLTDEQKRATAAFIFENTSEWTMEFTLKYYSHRWVLFKSSKALACKGE